MITFKQVSFTCKENGKFSGVVYVVLRLETSNILFEFIARVSPLKKSQHATVTVSLSLPCKFCSVRVNLVISEVMVEVYQIIV